MPSMNKTTNYGLNQWLGNEYPKRQDFMEDNAKIDAALTPEADPAKIPASNGPFKIVDWTSYFANRIKAIVGKGNWWDPPTKSMEQLSNEVAAHKAETMPHRFVDNGTTYRWGLSVANGIVMFNYEEAV
ncbi:hypothetical protein [Geosporobacter ferrireducens]|uniref:Uncharacterized protein n=1 Tax=Geosporobacter ferrireducens TaxID=1424294 RepID=A0A1D8GIF9_9FIRM|nr:hypothetical protein [Geosporobacter ferrireducens]AOT70694.1 hypothetical protein Gferi_14595 [Geosporobacter ferrireducens]